MNTDKKKHLQLMEIIRDTKKDKVCSLIDHLDDNSIDNICECMYNIIHTDLHLPKTKKTKLKNLIKNHCPTHHLNKITKQSIPVSNRRRALKQVGGFLPMILATAIPFLADLIFGRK